MGQYEHDGRLYTPVEFRRILDRVGFDDVEVLAGYEGEELDDPEDDVVVVGHKR